MSKCCLSPEQQDEAIKRYLRWNSHGRLGCRRRDNDRHQCKYYVDPDGSHTHLGPGTQCLCSCGRKFNGMPTTLLGDDYDFDRQVTV